MLTELLSAFILMALVIDPFGSVPLVNAMLSRVPEGRRWRVIVRECLIAFVTLGLFMIFGRKVLDLMHLSESALSIAGGVILFMIAIRLVFGYPEGAFGPVPQGEPFIVPLAIPLIAGPSALATVMLMAKRQPEKLLTWGIALTGAMVFTTLLLVSGARLQRVLGPQVMQAIERLTGLILTAIAVEMLLGGIRDFVGGL